VVSEQLILRGPANRTNQRNSAVKSGFINQSLKMIRKPRLMILDDATSAVDPSVEAEILRSLQAADLPSTIVMVAYRPATIRLADEVMFVDQKTVSAHGTHDQLLGTSPGYAELVQAYEEDARRVAAEHVRHESGSGSQR
jgi:ABC-type protease/lipase transport system fused ATPase/permease subunit